jgi:carbon monoxide dehydrogenase subunit G
LATVSVVLSVTTTAAVAAPPARVWELISDTRRYAEWVAGTDAVTRTDGPTAPGSTYDEVNPILGPWKARTRWTVAEHEPLRRQVHTSTDVPLLRRFDVVMELEPEGAGTRFTLTLRAQPALGPLGAAFGRLMRPKVARDNRRTVAQLTATLKLRS